MRKQAVKAAMQAFAAIDLCDAVYVACPVGSGRRELELMAALSLFDRDHLRRQHSSQWQRKVLDPNKTAAAAAVAAARLRHRGRSVINPAEFDLEGLTQADYDGLCENIIRSHVRRLVLADGWQFSRGARLEAALALELCLNVEDGSGAPLDPATVLLQMGEAAAQLVAAGFPEDVVSMLLPRFAPVS